MPTFVADAIKSQLKNFLADNDVQFDENANRTVLVAEVEGVLRGAGIDPAKFDLQTNRVVRFADDAPLPIHSSYRADVPPPDRFYLEPVGTAPARWDAYVEAFGYYWDAVGLPDGKKRSVLLHVVGPEVQLLFKGLKEDSTITDGYARALAALNGYFHPRKHSRYERYLFSKLTQGSDESVDAFVSRLRAQALHCSFTDVDDRILDQIVLHCSSSMLRDRLLRKGDKLTLEEALTEARVFESVQEQSAVMAKRPDVSALRSSTFSSASHSSASRSPTRSQSSPSWKSRPTYCGLCKHCNQIHEFKRGVCPVLYKEFKQEDNPPHRQHFNKPMRGKKKVRAIDVDQDDDSDESPVTFVSSVATQDGRQDSLFTSLHVAGQSCQFHLDTGAAVCLIPARYVPAGVQLSPPGKVGMYDGSPLHALGKCVLRVVNPRDGRRYDILFTVVREGTPLLSLNASVTMGFLIVNAHVIRKTTRQVKRHFGVRQVKMEPVRKICKYTPQDKTFLSQYHGSSFVPFQGR